MHRVTPQFHLKSISLLLALLLAAFVPLLAAAAPIFAVVDGTGLDAGQHSSLVLNSSGLPVISYYDTTHTSLKVAVCGNTTCTAGNTLTTVDNSATVGFYTSLVLNGSGFPVISYYDQSNGNLKVAVCGNATCTAGNTLTTVDNSAGVVGLYTSLALNGSGFPVISYYDATNGNLKVAICGNATCTLGNTLTTVDNNLGVVGQYTSLVLNGSGFPVISYYDQSTGNLKVAICGNAICTAGNTLTTVDNNAGIVGQYTSLALNSSGFPVISYYDATNGNLKLARCGNATCTAGNTLATVDNDAGVVGLYSSLALTGSNIPVISYYDQSNTNLKVARCGNVTCTASNTLTTVDNNAGVVGVHTSLVLNSSGFPVVSYYDQSNGDLKLYNDYTCATQVNTGPAVYGSYDAQAVRDALAAATSGDTVKVAGACAGAVLQSGSTQVTLITETLTVQGGYTTTNWASSNPALNPTTLDAQNSGRVVLINGVNGDLQNLSLINGNGGIVDGGGVYASNDLSLTNVNVISNTGGIGNGGGRRLCLWLRYAHRGTLRG